MNEQVYSQVIYHLVSIGQRPVLHPVNPSMERMKFPFLGVFYFMVNGTLNVCMFISSVSLETTKDLAKKGHEGQ